MKTPLAIASLALVPVVLNAQEKPDGQLGTDSLTLSAAYSNVDMGHYKSGLDLDQAGFVARLNKHIGADRGVGLDASLSFGTLSNQNNSESYDSTTNDYKLALRVYDQSYSAFTPFFALIGGYENTDFKNKLTKDKDSDGTAYFGGELGVEVHLAPGLSFSPYVDYSFPADDEYGSQTEIGASLNYWFTKHLGAEIDTRYSTNDHVNTMTVTAGVSFHF